MTAAPTKALRANLAVGIAGAVWGCFWFPTRYFEQAGMVDGMFSTALFAVTTVFLLPLAVYCWRNWRSSARPLLQIGIWTGAAFALYANALVLTEVVRALLLFYLTPIWSTALGIAVLGERLTVQRVLAIILGVSGGLVILGLDLGIPMPRNIGDWMALVAGVCWSIASVHMARNENIPVTGQTFAYAAGSLVFSLAVLALLTPAGTTATLPPMTLELSLFLIGFAMLVNLPCMTALIWGAGLLSPGRVGILLCAELAFGVASAAVFAGEPFGIREALGTALILAAVLVEVSGSSKPAANGTTVRGVAK